VSFVSLGRAFCSGLATGTVLTLIVVPLLYTIIEDLKDWIVAYFAGLVSLRKRQPVELPSSAMN
jgi:hypothetical protein